MMSKKIGRYVATFAHVLCLLTIISCDDSQLKQTNLLFIMFDDLRPQLSVYGSSYMITPNFERLAARSVVFDNVHAQISVCNPSRDSLLTGLRPDTIGTYAFQSNFKPFLSIPTRLAKAGYNTASYGKIFHWGSKDESLWNYEHWDDNWYKYQNQEWNFMNSSIMPDRIKPEKEFRDYLFATKSIEALKELNKKNEYFMLAVGFKNPHLALHVPYKYYKMYENKKKSWKLTKKELRFPLSAPAIAYRCCADKNIILMEKEGSVMSKNLIPVGDINNGFTDSMHDELILGYAAAITFVDKQLGRILDAIDELELWGNLTIVLTADHGMHNGEKGYGNKYVHIYIFIFIYTTLMPSNYIKYECAHAFIRLCTYYEYIYTNMYL
jgi:iduronate 2-sulfatase